MFFFYYTECDLFYRIMGIMIKDVEKRLAEYRATKAHKETKITYDKSEVVQIPSDQNSQPKTVPKLKSECKTAQISKKVKNKTPIRKETLDVIAEANSLNSRATAVTSSNFFGKYKRQIDILVNLLKFTIWLLLMTVFVEVEFGAVFFICSIFYLIFRNFRSSPKQVGEPSAYSVFNPNCEAIDGTLTAEQLERELIRGPK